MTESLPNILFLFPDQWRGDWLSTNPQLPLRLPNLERLAARGTTLTQAVSPSPICAPCRAILASGMQYERCRVPSNARDFPLDQPTMYQALQGKGYHTMGCGKFDLHKGSCDWHLDGSRSLAEWGFSAGIDNEGKWDGAGSGRETPRGPYLRFLEENGLRQAHLDDFDRRRGNPSAVFPTTLPEEAYCDNWLADNGLKLLREAPADRPWFLQVNFTGPHDPWDITRNMADWYADVDFPQPVASTLLTPEAHLGIRRNYAAMCENIDRRIGDLLAEVERRGESERTVVVFSSDHGEMLGDHDRFGKAVPWNGSVHVPLIIAGPGIPAGATCDQPIPMLDLAATFLDWAGASMDMDARSLRPLLEGRRHFHREVAYSAYGGWRMVTDGRFKLIRNFLETDWLFDLLHDPGELHNLLSCATGPAAEARLRLMAQMEQYTC